MSSDAKQPPPIPPIGVKLSTDLEQRRSGVRARARWTDPLTKKRETRALIVPDEEAAEDFFRQLQRSAELGVDLTTTLSDYMEQIGDRWKRGLDSTSTVQGYEIGMRLRVLPSLGHVPVASLTTGMIDRTIDGWEERYYSSSVIKHSVAPLVRILDEAVRDEIIVVNPARNRSRRSLGKRTAQDLTEDVSPRSYALPNLEKLNELADACAKVHQCYSDYVMLAALLAARSSEVSGLQVGDVDWDAHIVTIRRQTHPGVGGLVTKQTKGRDIRHVPILQPLKPVLERLTKDRAPEERLVVGPRGGVLTTATVRDATHWDDLVKGINEPTLTRHSLRHTGATWMADAGIPLHVLQKILGHKSLETTRGYLHPDNRQLLEAADLANAFFEAQQPGTEQHAARTRKPRHDASKTSSPGR